MLVLGLKIKLIKDPIHGYISLSEDEVRVVDTRAVQRLRRVIQLPFVYLVYPGARHSRFDHSLGCMYLAGEIAEKLGLDDYRRRALRIAGLLHDLGHTPYSHLLEPLLTDRGLSHELMTLKILEEDEELKEAVERCGLKVKDVSRILRGEVEESAIISGPTDIDKLDFLMRDSYFTGAAYGLVDAKRIILRSRLINGKLMLNIRAIGAVEEMAIARYQSFMNIYFHHAVRAAQILFLRGVKALEDKLDFSAMTIDEYLGHDDYTIWCMMKRDEKGRKILDRIERRILPKMAYELRVPEKTLPKELMGREGVERAEEELARLARIPRENIWIDTPYIPPLPCMDDEAVQFYEECEGGVKVLAHRSALLDFTSKIYGIVRVYTEKGYLDRVREAASKYFSSI